MSDTKDKREERGPDTDAPPESVDQTLVQSDIQQARSKEISSTEIFAEPRLPGYELRHRLGGGAYGEVWLAVQMNTGREVAIKFFSRHKGLDWPLLRREVGKLVQVISERRVVHLLEVGWDADPPYYVMEYLEGGSLADRLDDKPLPVGEAVQLFRELAEALVYLHSKAVLHCDLKPSNVLLDARGQIRLADFGQARLSTERGPAVGTLFYMAPEQTEPNARPDVRSDIYSLGALLYTMLTGSPPYATDDAAHELASTGTTSERIERYRQLIQDSPPPMKHRRLAGIDKTLADIIDKCLRADPLERFENVQQVLNALSARERQRTQKPLVTFGILGPAALLLGMAAMGIWVWSEAESGARRALTQQTLENDLGTARVIAAVVDRNLSAVQRQVSREADRRDLRGLMSAETATSKPADKEILHAELQAYTASLYDDYKDRHFHNWVVADRDAVVIARSPYDKKVVGSRYAYREWFTGKDEVKPDEIPPNVAPRQEVSLTLAFKSTAQGNPILISVASPIRDLDSHEVIGVLSATIHLVTFNEWLETSEGHITDEGCPPRMAILINRNQLVRHPCPGEFAPHPPVSHELFFDTPEVQALLAEKDAVMEDYSDPLRSDETYLAAFSRLEENSDWFAIVQHDRRVATAPVTQLAGQIQWLGWMALGAGLIGVGVLWVLLFRVTREPTPLVSEKSSTEETE
jgi:serine/threonine protein kinase